MPANLMRVAVWLAAAFLFAGVTPAWAAKLAFVRASTTSQQSDIYLMDDSGGGPALLTSDGSHNEFPVLSHDGTRVAFDSNRSGHFQLYTMGLDGSSPVNVSNSSTSDKYPSWSPDDSQIAYVAGGDIFKMNADGTGKARLETGLQNVGQVTWSPDGSKIAFSGYGGSAYHIYTMAPDGSLLTDITAVTGLSGESPAWSPDSKQLAFDATRLYDWDVYVMDADGSNAHDITPAASGSNPPDVSPTWSPDGSTIVFSSTRNEPNNVYRLFSMPANGGTAVNQLTFDDPTVAQFIDQNPSYQPQPIAAPPSAPPALRYVALGDSVPAGEGINYGWTWVLDSSGNDGTWQIGDSSPNWFERYVPAACHQSDKSYPYLMSGLVNWQTPTNLACTGAQGEAGVLCPQFFQRH